jgi:hypothetical protein
MVTQYQSSNTHRTGGFPQFHVIRRFLQHALPAGVHKVRYYGLWSPSNHKKLLELQQTLTQSGKDEQKDLKKILMWRYLLHQNPENTLIAKRECSSV